MISLFRYQRKIPTTRNCALYWDMGLGKTFGSMFKANYYGDKLRIVVCQKSKIQDWIDELRAFYGKGVQIYNLTKKKEYDTFCGLTDLQEITYAIINYDLVWRRTLEPHSFTLILDESSEIKHRTTKKTKAVMKLGFKSNHNILLSGTPCGGKYELMCTQCNLLGWDIQDMDFYNIYTEWYYNYDISTIPIKQIKCYKDISNSFIPNLNKFGAEFLKTKDYHDLPEQIEKNIYSKTPIEYNKFRKNSILLTENKEWVGDTSLVKLLYERMILGLYDKEKQNSLLDIINSTDKRVIVFYNFKEEIKTFTNLIKDRPVSMVNGDKRDLKNYNDYDNSIVFVQYQAGAKGLNLQKSNYTIFYTPPLSAELYAQAKKRTHRVGQNKTCYYYKLIAKGSVEEKIYSSLEKGVDYELKLFEKNLYK